MPERTWEDDGKIVNTTDVKLLIGEYFTTYQHDRALHVILSSIGRHPNHEVRELAHSLAHKFSTKVEYHLDKGHLARLAAPVGS